MSGHKVSNHQGLGRSASPGRGAVVYRRETIGRGSPASGRVLTPMRHGDVPVTPVFPEASQRQEKMIQDASCEKRMDVTHVSMKQVTPLHDMTTDESVTLVKVLPCLQDFRKVLEGVDTKSERFAEIAEAIRNTVIWSVAQSSDTAVTCVEALERLRNFEASQKSLKESNRELFLLMREASLSTICSGQSRVEDPTHVATRGSMASSETVVYNCVPFHVELKIATDQDSVLRQSKLLEEKETLLETELRYIAEAIGLKALKAPFVFGPEEKGSLVALAVLLAAIRSVTETSHVTEARLLRWISRVVQGQARVAWFGTVASGETIDQRLSHFIGRYTKDFNSVGSLKRWLSTLRQAKDESIMAFMSRVTIYLGVLDTTCQEGVVEQITRAIDEDWSLRNQLLFSEISHAARGVLSGQIDSENGVWSTFLRKWEPSLHLERGGPTRLIDSERSRSDSDRESDGGGEDPGSGPDDDENIQPDEQE